MEKSIYQECAESNCIFVSAGEKIAGIAYSPESLQGMRENLERILQFMSAKRIRMHQISSKEILEGNLKAVMRLILALAAHYKPQSVRHHDASAAAAAAAVGGFDAAAQQHPQQQKQQQQQQSSKREMVVENAQVHNAGTAEGNFELPSSFYFRFPLIMSISFSCCFFFSNFELQMQQPIFPRFNSFPLFPFLNFPLIIHSQCVCTYIGSIYIRVRM